MKTVIGLILYAIVSGVSGVVICSILTFFKLPRASYIAAWIFFGGPVCVWLYVEARDNWNEHQFKQDVAYVKELCERHGGDKIYRTVDNVEGIFQITFREPVTSELLRDQTAMPNPWARVLLDSENPAVGVGPKAAEEGRNGYWFLEQRLSSSEGPPYRRRFSTSPYELEVKVSNLRSRYGYSTEDISTPDMRARWIAGGRINLIDMKTGETLATRTGFFKALGPNYKDAWGGVLGTEHICPRDEYLGAFLRKVLRPIQALPSEEEVKSIKEE